MSRRLISPSQTSSEFRFTQLEDNKLFESIFHGMEDPATFMKREKDFQGKIEKMDEHSHVCKLTYGARQRTADISKNEFRVLEPSQYLNDKIIMFQLMFVQHYVIDESLRNLVYIADP